MNETRQPPLVHHLARVCVPPPYIHRGVKVHAFPIGVGRDRLQDLCDAWFAGPSSGALRYRALLSAVFIVAVNIDEIAPGNPAHADEGRTPEIELGLWTLAARTEPFSPVPRWLPLRLLVDSADAVVVGREVYGFPKEFGRCNVPSTAPSRGPFAAAGHVTPTPGGVMTWSDVLRVEPTHAAPLPRPAVWHTIEEANVAWQLWLATHLDPGAVDAATRQSMIAAASLQLLPFLFLKQTISESGQDSSCYQAVVEASPSLRVFRLGGVNPDSFRAQVYSYPSHPFASVLGIRSGTWLDVGHGIWADLDFTMGEGRVLFEATR
jgi:hypothetical protein